jgi:hypothetical protein
MLIFFKLKLINLMSKLFMDDAHAPYAAASRQQRSPKNLMNKPLPQSPLLKNRYCFLVFSRKMSTNISTDNLDDASCDNFAIYTEDPEDKDLAFNQ